MEKIVVSACLLGKPCRYDGKSCPNEKVIAYCKDKQVFPVCPEQWGGLSTPRSSCEIIGNHVMNQLGEDCTLQYQLGAKKVVELVQKEQITAAILKSKSPSCGCGKIYDGSFSRTLIDGNGICAQALLDIGVCVMDEEKVGFKK